MKIEHVGLTDIFASNAWIKDDASLPLMLEVDDSGEIKPGDLAKMHSILIVGETGTGKVLFVQNMVAGLCLKYSSKQLKIIAVDLKAVEYGWAGGFSQLETVTSLELIIPKILNHDNAMRCLLESECCTADCRGLIEIAHWQICLFDNKKIAVRCLKKAANIAETEEDFMRLEEVFIALNLDDLAKYCRSQYATNNMETVYEISNK